jgi:heat shock protein HslJ
MKPYKLLIAVLVILSSCRAMTGSSDDIKLEGTNWQLIAMDKKPSDLGDRATIMFNEKDMKIAGKAACNSIFGGYELNRNNISFTGIGSTKMFCDGMMDKENQIVTNLQKIKKFEIKYGLLYLYGSDNELLLTYKKVNPPIQGAMN